MVKYTKSYDPFMNGGWCAYFSAGHAPKLSDFMSSNILYLYDIKLNLIQYIEKKVSK